MLLGKKRPMSGFRFEAYAIVSADGMLADAHRHMPGQLHIAADQGFFTEALDRAVVCGSDVKKASRTPTCFVLP
jgi:hypothetical protein